MKQSRGPGVVDVEVDNRADGDPGHAYRTVREFLPGPL